MRHLVVDSAETVEDEAVSSVVRASDDSNREIIVDEAGSSRRDIVSIASDIEDRERESEKFFSLELFPSKRVDKEVYESFFSEINRHSSPLFYALTWHCNYDSDKNYLPLEIVRDFPNNTLLHIAGNKLKKAEVVEILNDVIAQGKRNIFVLRGDESSKSGDFAHAVDLVKFIRKHYGPQLCLCVAGYPQMHPESNSKEEDLMHLKEKVDAGANLIITQIFFESKVFIDFVKDCRNFGIKVPIIPGIFPIPNNITLEKMAKVCNVEIPPTVTKDLQRIKDDDESVRTYGIALARKLITEIFEARAASGIHLFTLNRASIALDVCSGLFQ